MSRPIADISIRRAPRRAMTLIELMIGMVITAMVLSAMSALWFAMARTWSDGSSTQHVSVTASQAVARLESTFRPAKYIFQYTAGSTDGKSTPTASALIWLGDTWGGSADAAVQIGELALIEHDAVAQKIYLYKAIASGSMSASQLTRASGVATYSELTSSTLPATFKTYDFVTKTTLSEAVAGLLFNSPSLTSTSRQLIEFTLTITRSSGSALLYGATALRGPTTKPV